MKVVKDILKWVNDQCQIRLSSTELTTISDGTELIFTPQYIDGVENPLFPSSYTETNVNIPSGVAGVSGIKGMGTNPIELLPAPGVGKYYDWKLIFESTGSDYTLAANLLIDCQPYGNGLIEITPFLLTDGVNQTFEVNSATQSQPLNQSINLTTVGSVNPTLGNGTLRVKIYHKTITFGS